MNQRRRTRVHSRKPATITAASGSPCEGEIANLSLKGCLVSLTRGAAPRVGEEVSLVIHLEPDDEALDVHLQGRVVRHDPGAVAVDFERVPPESFHHLFRLVQYNSPDPEEIEGELASSAFDGRSES